MEKEIVWTATAQNDFREIYSYLQQHWANEVIHRFHSRLELKLQLLQKQPNIGFKSLKHSRFRQTLITRHYNKLLNPFRL